MPDAALSRVGDSSNSGECPGRGDQAQMMFATAHPMRSCAQAGKAKLVAVTGPASGRRMPAGLDREVPRHLRLCATLYATFPSVQEAASGPSDWVHSMSANRVGASRDLRRGPRYFVSTKNCGPPAPAGCADCRASAPVARSISKIEIVLLPWFAV